MKVSLVTTVKDEAKSVDRLVAAVRAQTRRPDEWVVVDGGSRDETVARLRDLSVHPVLVEPGNIARGRNTAIERASGEIIAVIDAGCRPEPNWLEKLVAPLEAGQGQVTAGRTYPRIERPLDAMQWVLLDQFVTGVHGWRRPALSSRCVAFQRRVWSDCPYPDWLEVGEDTWLFREWRRRGWSLLIVEDAVVEWNMRPTPWAFLRQHFRYMRGDGRALMRSLPNLARLGFYGSLVTLLGLGAHLPAALWVVMAAWISYLAATCVRLPGVVKGREPGFALHTIGVLPFALVSMDIAKIFGYLTGLVDRLISFVDRRAECPGSR